MEREYDGVWSHKGLNEGGRMEIKYGFYGRWNEWKFVTEQRNFGWCMVRRKMSWCLISVIFFLSFVEFFFASCIA